MKLNKEREKENNNSDRCYELGRTKNSPLEIDPEKFKKVGYKLVDQIVQYLSSIGELPVSPSQSPEQLREVLGKVGLPESGRDPEEIIEQAMELIFNHSLHNGHPNFWGYITSSAAPIGMLSDFLASAVNPNVGSWLLSPIANEIEAQTIRWISELIGYEPDTDGLLVSGGNMANFIGFLAGRRAKVNWNLRSEGLASANAKPLRVYTSKETHTWIEKAADLFGLGTNAVRVISTNAQQEMDIVELRNKIEIDLSNNEMPIMVVATAGTVSTGAVDPIEAIADICSQYGLWLHIDAAYGGFAAASKCAPGELSFLKKADSVAVDPHKWLYMPLEAGCVLVRHKGHLKETFGFFPPYYKFDESLPTNYNHMGMQNSRGFRALKIWNALQHVGRQGYCQMITEDICLARRLAELIKQEPELEWVSLGLSIVTFRFYSDLFNSTEKPETFSEKVNREILDEIQLGGEAYISHAVVEGKFVLRVCIVNFRTRMEHVEKLPALVVNAGQKVMQKLMEKELMDDVAS